MPSGVLKVPRVLMALTPFDQAVSVGEVRDSSRDRQLSLWGQCPVQRDRQFLSTAV
jgi:hypothetical protein